MGVAVWLPLGAGDGLSVSDAVTSCDRVIACEGVTLDVNEVVDACVDVHVEVSPAVTV